MTAPKRPAPKRPAPKCPRAQTAAPKRRRPNGGAQKSRTQTFRLQTFRLLLYTSVQKIYTSNLSFSKSLFSSIPITTYPTNYNLRPRAHEFKLPLKDDRNFVPR